MANGKQQVWRVDPSMSAQDTLEAVKTVAVMASTFYTQLVQAGVPSEAATLLTNTYITQAMQMAAALQLGKS